MPDEPKGSRGYLRIEGIGNLVADPEMRYTPKGKAVCDFRCAFNMPVWNGEETENKALWGRITTWGPLAENCNKFLAKGRKIFFEGRLDFDAETGNPKIFTRRDDSVGTGFEFTATNVIFLSPANGNSTQSQPAAVEEEVIEFG